MYQKTMVLVCVKDKLVAYKKYSPVLDNYQSMMASSNGNILRVTGPLCEKSPVTGEFPSQRSSNADFDVLFDLRLNKWLSKIVRLVILDTIAPIMLSQ